MSVNIMGTTYAIVEEGADLIKYKMLSGSSQIYLGEVIYVIFMVSGLVNQSRVYEVPTKFLYDDNITLLVETVVMTLMNVKSGCMTLSEEECTNCG
jgi:hypothetical protein